MNAKSIEMVKVGGAFSHLLNYPVSGLATDEVNARTMQHLVQKTRQWKSKEE